MDVQAEKAKADFENGVITIVLPKAETVKPKTISIKAKYALVGALTRKARSSITRAAGLCCLKRRCFT
jgi:sulfur transfer protein SufE